MQIERTLSKCQNQNRGDGFFEQGRKMLLDQRGQNGDVEEDHCTQAHFTQDEHAAREAGQRLDQAVGVGGKGPGQPGEGVRQGVGDVQFVLG